MSPLKLFDYMASKKIIVASKMNVYKHILNKKNSVLINSGSPNIWANEIENVFNNLNKYKKLGNSANKLVKKYTWDNRINKIIRFSNVGIQ